MPALRKTQKLAMHIAVYIDIERGTFAYDIHGDDTLPPQVRVAVALNAIRQLTAHEWLGNGVLFGPA